MDPLLLTLGLNSLNSHKSEFFTKVLLRGETKHLWLPLTVDTILTASTIGLFLLNVKELKNLGHEVRSLCQFLNVFTTSY